MAAPSQKSTSFGDEEGTSAAAAALAGMAVIDLVHLSRQTMGDSVLETELLTLFQRQALQFAERLAQAASEGESKWRADLAHTLKGSARAIGAFKLAQAAEDYEEALRAKASGVDEKLRTLAATLVETRAAIAPLLERM